MVGLALCFLVSLRAGAVDSPQEVLTTPGTWIGDFSTPHGCTWTITDGAVDDQGRLYLRPSSASCGNAVGQLIVHDPTTGQFSAIGDFRWNDRSGQIGTLTFFDGGLYVGGLFTHIDDVAANGIARLDIGSGQWSAIGDGSGVSANGQVATMKVTATDVWISGNFTQAGGMPAIRIARFDRITGQWDALGEGLNQMADALAVDDDGRLVAGGRFTEAGGQPAASLAAWDGEAWIPIEGIQTNGWVRALKTWDDRLYVGGGFRLSDTPTVNRSLAIWENGQWTTLDAELASVVDSPSGLNAATVFSLARVGDMLYVGGTFERAGETELRNVGRWNPATNTWSALGDGAENGLLTAVGIQPGARKLVAFENHLFALGLFTVAGGQPVNNLARFDIVTGTWSSLGPGDGQGINGQNVRSLSMAGNEIVLSGLFFQSGLVRTQSIARWNPGAGSWSAFGTPSGPAIRTGVSRTAVAGGDLFAAGAFSFLVDDIDDPGEWIETFGLVRWDEPSQGWQNVDGATSNLRSVLALAGAGDDLFVGGNFTEAGGQPANRIARWSTASQSWSTLGVGVDGQVRAIAVGADGQIHVGGDFQTAGGAAAAGIAAWNPISEGWTGLGTGLQNSDGSPAQVHAIGIGPDGDVFAGGLFDRAGPTPVNNIARWDGDQWHALGEGLAHEEVASSAIVYALAVAENGDVFAGGNFNRAGGRPANHIARWDGSHWSVLGTDAEDNGVDRILSGVSGLALIGADLFVSGGFNVAGGRPATHFAHFTRQLGGAEVEININVEELSNLPEQQSIRLAARSFASGLRYTVDVRNRGQNTARNVDFRITAEPEPVLVEWTCQAFAGSASCPATAGTGLPELVFNLPGLSALRFELLFSVSEAAEVYEQSLGASTRLEPVFDNDIAEAQSTSAILVNDRIFGERFETADR